MHEKALLVESHAKSRSFFLSLQANLLKLSIKMRHGTFLSILAVMLCLLTCKTRATDTIYQFSALQNKGQEVSFANRKGKVVGRFEPTTEPAQLEQPIEEQL